MAQSVFPAPSTTPIVGASNLAASGEMGAKCFYKSSTLAAGDYLVYVEADNGWNTSDADYVSVSAYNSNVWLGAEYVDSSKPIRVRLTSNESIVVGTVLSKFGAEYEPNDNRTFRLSTINSAPAPAIYNAKIRDTDDLFIPYKDANGAGSASWFSITSNKPNWMDPDTSSSFTPASGTSAYQQSVGKVNNIYYYSAGGTGQFAHTTDKSTWTTSTTYDSVGGTTGYITDVAYGNSVYVLVTADGYINSSTNFTTWTKRTSGWEGTNGLYAVTFQNGKFVAVGSSGAISTSTDGVTWTKITTLTSNTDMNLRTVEGIGNTWVTYSGSANNSVHSTYPLGARSVDNGATWTTFKLTHTYGASQISTSITSFIYARTSTGNADWGRNRMFVYDGFFYISTNRGVFISSDGINWNPTYGMPTDNWTPVVSPTQGLFFILGVADSNRDYIRAQAGRNRKVFIYKAS